MARAVARPRRGDQPSLGQITSIKTRNRVPEHGPDTGGRHAALGAPPPPQARPEQGATPARPACGHGGPGPTNPRRPGPRCSALHERAAAEPRWRPALKHDRRMSMLPLRPGPASRVEASPSARMGPPQAGHCAPQAWPPAHTPAPPLAAASRRAGRRLGRERSLHPVRRATGTVTARPRGAKARLGAGRPDLARARRRNAPGRPKHFGSGWRNASGKRFSSARRSEACFDPQLTAVLNMRDGRSWPKAERPLSYDLSLETAVHSARKLCNELFMVDPMGGQRFRIVRSGPLRRWQIDRAALRTRGLRFTAYCWVKAASGSVGRGRTWPERGARHRLVLLPAAS